MKTIEVAVSKTYNVLIGSGTLAGLGEIARGAAPRGERAAVISDDTVAALYAAGVEESLEKAGFSVVRFTLPHGEQSKNGSSYLQILDFLAGKHMSRSDLILALGGGMVGDIAGFCAATYMRGIKYIQIPTTLLAMVDSSVGGKTAIDLPAGKNLAGAFYQPDAVVCDCDVLRSLPEDILRDGCAEVLKYGILGDVELFRHMRVKGLEFDREFVISRSVAMKRDYVCADERDTGVRRMLNLGHTLGHAVEKLSNFGLSHGKSVAIGMATVARACAERGICSRDCAEEIEAGIKALGLPTVSGESLSAIEEIMLSDKKRNGSVMSVIVPEKIGKCSVLDIPVEELGDFMKAGF